MGSQQEPQTTGVWIFKEQDAEGILTGRITTFEGVELQPLRYSDLAGMKLDGPVNIPLNWSAVVGCHLDWPCVRTWW